ncbi:MAG: DUF424 family protein [Methanomassiliicoccaceae archaeon]|nr:DUF424 family protein [Methanomassiliicoccaceae archaeon]MCL2145586.1 DUF424 family protein [Methanomassiliicoccaceae archaeon]
MISCKIHVHENERILAACDLEILGMTFRGDGVKIKVSEIFYGGEAVSEEAFVERTRSVTIMNIVGNRAVEIAVKEGLVSEQSVMVIGEVKHAQVVIM